MSYLDDINKAFTKAGYSVEKIVDTAVEKLRIQGSELEYNVRSALNLDTTPPDVHDEEYDEEEMDDDDYDMTCPDQGVIFALVSEDGIVDRYYSLGDDQVVLLGREDVFIPYLTKRNFADQIFEWQTVVRAYTDEDMTFSIIPMLSDMEED